MWHELVLHCGREAPRRDRRRDAHDGLLHRARRGAPRDREAGAGRRSRRLQGRGRRRGGAARGRGRRRGPDRGADARRRRRPLGGRHGRAAHGVPGVQRHGDPPASDRRLRGGRV
ncbi:MAG: hypothetical protein EON52_19550 [Actinomycetales bacterium]|nr:MAG: hypothetical protein EON52_19550 [Actinomycetales bacterium]